MAALVILRCVYSLTPVLLPVLPDCTKETWASVTSGVLFVTVIIYHLVMADRSRQYKNAVKRTAKYQRKPAVVYTLTVAVLAGLIIFSLRGFKYFPVVVFTGSMAGTMDRGSVVFIEKLRRQDVFGAVGEGDVVLFQMRDLEMVHRVIAFEYNENGERLYVTKGDANSSADTDPADGRRILGVSRAHIPYIGYPFVLFQAIFEG
jgi:signal peptidase I